MVCLEKIVARPDPRSSLGKRRAELTDSAVWEVVDIPGIALYRETRKPEQVGWRIATCSTRRLARAIRMGQNNSRLRKQIESAVGRQRFSTKASAVQALLMVVQTIHSQE